MKNQFLSAGKASGILLTLAIAGCTSTQPQENSQQAQAPMEQTQAEENILLAEWTGPYGGVPAFDKMNLADLKPAIEKGMAMNLAEIDSIASNPNPPTFENTIEALERAGFRSARFILSKAGTPP